MIKEYWNKIDPRYQGIVLFVIFLFASNYFWEFAVDGDKDPYAIVTVFGCNISSFINVVISWFASVVHNVLNLFGVSTQLVNNSNCFANQHSCSIICGCSGVKQAFIMVVIILCSRGPLIHKLWYSVLSVIVLAGFNIFRLSLLTYIVRDHIEWFTVLHDHVLKYAFYFTIFLLWLFWDEYLRIKLSSKKI